jgi:hypothetical protein
MSEPLKPVDVNSQSKIPEVVFAENPVGLSLEQPSDKPYDPGRDREFVRSWVAYGLLGLLIVIVLLSFIALWAHGITKDDLKEILTIFFGPIITLLGAVTGFYYGEKSKYN